MQVFDGKTASPEVAAAVADADALLISAAPAEGADPVLGALADAIARAPRLRSVVLLSTLGVYADSGGAWIDESAEVSPGLARRGSARVDAEAAWRQLGARHNLPVAILRLGGIYGPGQNGMARLLRGGVPRRQARPCVGVFDIAQAIAVSRAAPLLRTNPVGRFRPATQIAFAQSRTAPPRSPGGGREGRLALRAQLRRLHPGGNSSTTLA